MNRRNRRRNSSLAGQGRGKGADARRPQMRPGTTGIRLGFADRRTLLLGTALASTLLLGVVTAPAPASAQVACPPGTFPPPGPIEIINPGDSINCVNVFNRNDATGIVINLETDAGGEFISLDNSGRLTATDPGNATGIRTYTDGIGSFITIENAGDIRATGGIFASGIYAVTDDDQSAIDITNSGAIRVTGGNNGSHGIFADTDGDTSPITIWNSGDIISTNSSAFGNSFGIYAEAYVNSRIDIWNSGDITATSAGGDARAIYAFSFEMQSPLVITNSGGLTVNAFDLAIGIEADTRGASSNITITNHGPITVTGAFGVGISGGTGVGSDDSAITIMNWGPIRVTADSAYGITAFTAGTNNNPITIQNSGPIWVNGVYDAVGIGIEAEPTNSPINITNSGDITATVTQVHGEAKGIRVLLDNTAINTPVTITNSGSVFAQGPSGADVAAIHASSVSGTTIVNSGDIGASSNNAIRITYGAATILNTGTITGFVLLDADDVFVNQAGGVFNARQSLFAGDQHARLPLQS